MRTVRYSALAAFVFAIGVRPGAAEPIRLGPEQGAVFDAVIDGFPDLAPLDGQPDFAGNALAVGLKAGATEERAIAEFPLASLGDIATGDVARATLTFNIDDVLSTFGPGTTFAGRAATEIVVHLYAGDGAVALSDYLAVEREPHVVDTRPFGTITDASLSTSGPLIFEVDVTADVRAVVDGGADWVGVVWRTTDTPTGTSLDHLGDAGAGPPGMNGSFLPFVEVELVPPASPTPTATPIPDTATSTTSPPHDGSPTPSERTCAGDCDGNSAVSVDELIRGVNMALGNDPVGNCSAFDANRDATVSVDELVRAVGAALGGCSMVTNDARLSQRH